MGLAARGAGGAWIAYHPPKERCNQDAQHADDEKGIAPIDQCSDDAAEHDSAGAADGDTKGIEGKRPRPLLGGEHVGYQCIGGRNSACFSYANTQPCRKKLTEILCEATQSRHQTPYEQ